MCFNILLTPVDVVSAGPGHLQLIARGPRFNASCLQSETKHIDLTLKIRKHVVFVEKTANDFNYN
jgi:hypothetical protein